MRAPHLVLLCVGALVSAAVVRTNRLSVDDTTSPPPEPVVLRMTSLGHPSVAATVLWMQVVQRFASATHLSSVEQAPHRQWIATATRAIGEIDPRWEMPWVLGPAMVQILGSEADREDLLLHAPPTMGGRDAHKRVLHLFGMTPNAVEAPDESSNRTGQQPRESTVSP